MSYGLKYNCDFTNKVTSYSLEIYEKDYAGVTIEVEGAYPAVKHSYQTDRPIEPIKGSSITAQLLNQSNTLPLSDFYSEDDQKFKAKLIWHSTLSDVTLFEGFIVQENSGEIMVDKRHPINLSANDNLGLLKGVPFNEAFFQERTIIDTEFVDLEGVAPNTLIITNSDFTLLVGDVISTTGTLSGVYHVTGVSGSSITVFEPVATTAQETVTMIIFRADLYTLRTLLSFIKSCIQSTGLELNTRIFANINEVSQDPADCFLEQTLLDPQTFNSGGNWDDCYSVLTKILVRWKLTLFQAKGVWNIVRWNELRYYDYSIPGFEYDSDFSFVGAVELNEADSPFTGWDKFLIGIGETSVALEGLQRTITGASKFFQETMNYKQPENFLRNANLQELGNLITSYADGSNTVSEYDAPWWAYTDAYPSPSGVNGPAVFFIRIITDSVGNEIERYMVVKNNDIHSYQIEAQTGDVIKFSFRCRTTESFTAVSIFIRLTDGSSTVFAHASPDVPAWDTLTGYAVSETITNGEWFFIETESRAIPFDGLLTVYLRTFSTDGTGENCYSDINLEYIPLINQSSKIIGHVHKNSQTKLIKSKEESEISIDVTPRNSIAGTLFLDSITDVLQDRCGQWTRATASENRNLGDIITFEDLFLKRISRTQLEDTFYGVLSKVQNISAVNYVNHISMLSVMRYTHFATLNFIFGRLEIDYSNNQFTGNLFEMYEDSEVDADLVSAYLFNYLFAKK